MDHPEVLEQLELAAVEPGGIDRLMAGDTAAAAAVAGHLAGCEACAGELERLRRAAPLLRDVIRTTPPADLRDRTLALVRAQGVARGSAATGDMPATARHARVIGILPWVASMAAAVVISVVASTAYIGAQLDERLAVQERAVGGLEAVTAATLEITAEPDAQRVTLSPAAIPAASGTLLFSPRTTRLVVVATGLVEPPAGKEYRCWVVIDGARQSVGKMFFADALAYWVGVTPEVATVPAGTTFGVSLAEVGGSGAQTPAVIVGEL